MSLSNSGIDKVKAFAVPSGVWPDGTSVTAPRTALVKWRSTLTDKLYQVYINRRLTATTAESTQLQAVVPLPRSATTAVRIEVFAVEPSEVDTDFSDQLSQPYSNSSTVKLSLLRSQQLPIDSTFSVYYDAGTSQIDYENPLNSLPIPIWSVWQDKAGFGMGGFGVGDFGFDSAAAVGFGLGLFGQAHFGLDADTIEWTSEPLAAGIYKFGVKVTDKAGNQSSAAESDPITVTPAATPATELNVSSFDKQTNQLVLSIT